MTRLGIFTKAGWTWHATICLEASFAVLEDHFKPSTCPHNAVNRSPCSGGMRQYLLYYFINKQTQGKGKSAKKQKLTASGPTPDGREELFKKAPHTFVFHRGLVGKNIHELEMDIRRVMEPYTASKLKVNINCDLFRGRPELKTFSLIR